MARNLHSLHMKIAISIFRNNVSPRLDIAESFWIYEIQNGAVAGKELITLAFDQVDQLIMFLRKENVEKVFCGGCPGFFMRMLTTQGFEVIINVGGKPEFVVQNYIEGKLDPNFSQIPCNKWSGWLRMWGQNGAKKEK
jgi:predicted Fe-Mo cluster-binding NifX family protein